MVLYNLPNKLHKAQFLRKTANIIHKKTANNLFNVV